MLTIRNTADMARALDSPIDPQLKRLLTLRRDQLMADTGGDYDLGDLVQMIAVQPKDRLADVEAVAGFPLFTEPAFEWVQDHQGILETVVVLSDDGFGIALFVPDRQDIDPAMLSVLRQLLIHDNPIGSPAV